MFDPEEVEVEWFGRQPSEERFGNSYVRAKDYEELLKLYEEVVFHFKEISGKYNWMRGVDSE